MIWDLRTEHVKNFWNIIVIVIVVDFFITLPFSAIEGKVIKKSTTMTMTFQKFLTKPLLYTDVDDDFLGKKLTKL